MPEPRSAHGLQGETRRHGCFAKATSTPPCIGDQDLTAFGLKEIIPNCRAALYRVLLNLRANRCVTLGSRHCKRSLNQQLLADSMTPPQRLRPTSR
jgi:hypothetical protein